MELTLTTTQILAFASALIVINGAVMAIVSWAQKLMRPNKKREKRIKQLEKEVSSIHSFLESDDAKIREIEEGNKVTHKALLALLESGINGDNIEGMKEAKEAVNEYLINR